MAFGRAGEDHGEDFGSAVLLGIDSAGRGSVEREPGGRYHPQPRSSASAASCSVSGGKHSLFLPPISA